VFSISVKEQINNNIPNSVENQKNTIDLFFNERIAQLYTVANTNTFEELTDESSLNKIFDVMHAKSTSYIDIGMIDNEGNHLAYVGPYYNLLKTVNYKNELWFRAVKTHGVYVSDIFMGYRHAPHLIIALMVKERNTSWILRVTINIENINDIVHKSWTGKLNDAFLVNRENMLQTLPRFGGDFLEHPTYHDFSSTAATKVERRVFRGTDTFYAAAPLDNTKWVLVIKESPDELLSPLQEGINWALFFTTLGLVIIATGAALFTNTLIDRIKKTDRENAAKSDMLLQASKMIALSKMAAGIAHEVNNPLASIAERAGWMKDLLADQDIAGNEIFAEFNESVDKIEQHVDRARKIIRNLLGFARRGEPATGIININNLLDETTGFLENEARQLNIRIEKRYADNIPVITSDLSQIQQVVLNLLNNAIDAIEHNGTVTVTTRYLEKTDEVEIDVADTGKGIAENELNKVFDPFFTTKEVGKGTGLGLSISYSIIEKLGGKIRVQSKVGEGTVFTILLPKQ